MTDRITLHGLQVASQLHRFIERDVLPGTGIDSAAFWQGFGAIVIEKPTREGRLPATRGRVPIIGHGHRAAHRTV